MTPVCPKCMTRDYVVERAGTCPSCWLCHACHAEFHRLRVGLDIGGAASKYPDVFRRLAAALEAGGAEAWAISDMEREKALDMLRRNGIPVPQERVVQADYAEHGERCKQVVCERLGIDIMVDDHAGYLASGGHVRLLVMPDPDRPYYADEWRTDGAEGGFGRSKGFVARHAPGSNEESAKKSST